MRFLYKLTELLPKVPRFWLLRFIIIKQVLQEFDCLSGVLSGSKNGYLFSSEDLSKFL